MDEPAAGRAEGVILLNMAGKKAVLEATFLYIIALVLGIVLVIAYIIFVGPSHFLSDIYSFFSNQMGALFGGLKSF